MADGYGFVGALLRRLRYRDNGDNSYSPLVSLGPGQPAGYQASTVATAPGASTVLLSYTIPATGRYRIVASAYSDDTPAVGKRFALSCVTSPAAIRQHGPVGAQLAWTFPDVALNAGDTVQLGTNAAAAAGTSYCAWLAVYPLP